MSNSKILISFFILFTFSFLSCTKQSEDTLWNAAKGKMEEAARQREQNNQTEHDRLCNEALELLKQYLSDYPSSQKLPEVYNSMAVIYMSDLMDYNNAIKYFVELSVRYPESKYTKYAMFMTAYIYDELIKDKNKALEYYEKFVNKYPEDIQGEQFSLHAKEIIKMMREHRTVDDVIKSSIQNKDTTNKKLENKNNKNKIKSSETN